MQCQVYGGHYLCSAHVLPPETPSAVYVSVPVLSQEGLHSFDNNNKHKSVNLAPIQIGKSDYGWTREPDSKFESWQR